MRWFWDEPFPTQIPGFFSPCFAVLGRSERFSSSFSSFSQFACSLSQHSHPNPSPHHLLLLGLCIHRHPKSTWDHPKSHLIPKTPIHPIPTSSSQASPHPPASSQFPQYPPRKPFPAAGKTWNSPRRARRTSPSADILGGKAGIRSRKRRRPSPSGAISAISGKSPTWWSRIPGSASTGRTTSAWWVGMDPSDVGIVEFFFPDGEEAALGRARVFMGVFYVVFRVF